MHLKCPGPIAQLEERLNGIEEVVGSSPIGSTNTYRTHNSAGPHERPRLGDLARPKELAHLLGKIRDRVRTVQQHAALGQHRPRLVGGELEELLALAVLLDALRGVGHVEVGVLDDLPDPAHPAAHVF